MKIAPIVVCLATALQGCSQPSFDFTGKWVGEANMIIDGDRKNVPLRFEFSQTEAALDGRIHWEDYTRTITSATIEGPQIQFESAETNDTIRFRGTFKVDTIEGQFAIIHKIDPEPFPGRFQVSREK